MEPNYKKILVRMPNWLGDIVMATPVLTLLRQYCPSAHITVMCKDSFAPLFSQDDRIDSIMPFTKPKSLFSQEAKEIYAKIKQEAYDLGILLTNSFSSAWYFYKGNVKKRLGYLSFDRWLLLNSPIKMTADLQQVHQVKKYIKLLEKLGIEKAHAYPSLKLDSEYCKKATEPFLSHLQEEEYLIGIHPGASYGSAKCWPPEYFSALCDKLIQSNIGHVIFLGTGEQNDLITEITEKLPKKSYTNLCGETNISQLVAIINQLNVFVTNDSGPMHVASALHTPLVALFGSTDPSKTGPYNGGQIIYKAVECSPCFRRTCPIDFRCMKQISPHEVFFQILNLQKTNEKCLDRL